MSNVPPPIADSPKYPQLRQLLAWLRLATNFSFALIIAAALISLLNGVVTGRLSLGIGMSLVTVSVGAVGYLWSMATIEAIGVLIDIEANARKQRS